MADLHITNISKQMISIQVKPPQGDFYAEERQVRLKPGKSVSIPESHLILAQVENLKLKKQITVK